MGSVNKRLKTSHHQTPKGISKRKQRSYRDQEEQYDSDNNSDDQGSDDEWEQERQAKRLQQEGGQIDSQDDSEEEEEEEEERYAQFEDDEDVGEQLDEDSDPETTLKKELSSIPFTSLLKAQKQLSKQQQKASRAEDSESESEEEVRAESSKKGKRGRKERPMKKERSSKHAPMEMTSKKPVGRTRSVVETTTLKSRDPRFDTLSGSFKPSLFSSSYSFLTTSSLSELEELRKTAKLARKNVHLDEEEREKIEAALGRAESREVARGNRERDEMALRGWKKEEREKREKGKKEFWLKKSDKKAIMLKAKFDVLNEDKKALRKTLEKKRRKVGQKEKKLIPNTR